MTTKAKLEQRYRELDQELDDLYAMCEEYACDMYKVDCKQEAINILQDEIEEVSRKLDELDEDEEYRGWCDPAFRTFGDFYRMRV
ncbi:MAG: hypothetical protein J6V00_02235 [Bacteroidaceae bacterium]|nr:hypothetical protein [Bacteroidaceae bacterium]